MATRCFGLWICGVLHTGFEAKTGVNTSGEGPRSPFVSWSVLRGPVGTRVTWTTGGGVWWHLYLVTALVPSLTACLHRPGLCGELAGEHETDGGLLKHWASVNGPGAHGGLLVVGSRMGTVFFSKQLRL